MIRYIRYLLVIVLAVFVVEVYAADSITDVSLDTVQQTLEADSALTDMKQMSDRDIDRYLGIPETLYEEALYYRSVNSMVVDEFLFVHVKDSDSLKTVRDAIDTRISTQQTTFGDYAPAEAAKLNSAIVRVRGHYLFYAVGDASARWEQVFDGIQ